jgi:myosin heavy subunit
MEKELEEMVDLNLAARIMLVCNAHSIRDPEEINSRKERVKLEIINRMADRGTSGVEGLSELLDECIAKMELELELEQPVKIIKLNEKPEKKTKIKEKKEKPVAEPDSDLEAQYVEYRDQIDRQKKSTRDSGKQSSGYRPHSAAMPEKLATERRPIQTLLREDCVQIGLLKPKRADYLATQFAGKLPVEAEEEVLVELRKNLHEHLRRFMRKHNGGPWPTPKEQEDLRIEIEELPTVRSLLFVTREILRQRKEWLDKNSITGRLFGHRLKFGKDG